MAALICFYHAVAGLPVKSIWIATIELGNYFTWPDLTHDTAAKYFPNAEKTIKVHLTQTCQRLLSAKHKPKPPPPASSVLDIITSPLPSTLSRKVHICVTPLEKIYIDNVGCFLLGACSGNQYLIMVYHYNCNTISVTPFSTKHDRHCIRAYKSTMTRFKQ